MWKGLPKSSCVLYNYKPLLLNHKQMYNFYFSKNSRKFWNQNSRGKKKKKNGSSATHILKQWSLQIKQSYQTGDNLAYHISIQNIPKNHWRKKQMTTEHKCYIIFINFLYREMYLYFMEVVSMFICFFLYSSTHNKMHNIKNLKSLKF